MTDSGPSSDDVRDSAPAGERQTPQRARADTQPVETGRETSHQKHQDPVQAGFPATDLYEIATWDVRSPLDRFAHFLSSVADVTKRYALVALGLVFFLAQVAIVGLIVFEDPVLAGLSGLSILPALVLAATFWTSDPTRREPLLLLVVTFLLSVLFASFAAAINSAVLPLFELIPLVGLPLFYFLVVGPIEEFVKWLAVRVHAFRAVEFDTVVDGAVYGAVAGLGFAAIENLVYIVFFSVGGTPAELVVEREFAIATAVTRSFVGPGHVIFSAWAGFYLGLAKFNPAHKRAIVIKGLLIAAFIHATYNTLVTILPLSILPFVAFVVVYHSFWFGLLYRKIAAYHRYYRTLATPHS